MTTAEGRWGGRQPAFPPLIGVNPMLPALENAPPAPLWWDDREEQEYARDDDEEPHDDDDDSPDADAGYDSPDAGYDSHDGGGFDRGGAGWYHAYH